MCHVDNAPADLFELNHVQASANTFTSNDRNSSSSVVIRNEELIWKLHVLITALLSRPATEQVSP